MVLGYSHGGPAQIDNFLPQFFIKGCLTVEHPAHGRGRAFLAEEITGLVANEQLFFREFQIHVWLP